MDHEALVRQLVEHEGLKLFPYTDTVGKLTVGVGRNLTDGGISNAEALLLCDNDIAKVLGDLDHFLPWWRMVSEVRQRVIADLCFNLGISKLMAFRNTLADMKAGDADRAAVGLLASKWAEQVGRRARRLAQMYRTDADVPLAAVDG